MGSSMNHKKSSNYKPRSGDVANVCMHQFPDCPTEKNEKACHACPYYNT